MPTPRTTGPLLTTALVISACASSPHDEARALIVDAEDALGAVAENNPGFAEALDRAKGVLIVPRIRKVAFILSMAAGNGVLLARNDDGSFGLPAFYWLTGAGFGAQIGLEESATVLLFDTQRAWDLALDGPVNIGTQVSIADGKSATAAAAQPTDEATAGKPGPDVLAYSSKLGATIGGYIEGSTLDVDAEHNAAYYGKALQAKEIVVSREAKSAEHQRLRKALADLTTGSPDN